MEYTLFEPFTSNTRDLYFFSVEYRQVDFTLINYMGVTREISVHRQYKTCVHVYT